MFALVSPFATVYMQSSVIFSFHSGQNLTEPQTRVLCFPKKSTGYGRLHVVKSPAAKKGLIEAKPAELDGLLHRTNDRSRRGKLLNHLSISIEGKSEQRSVRQNLFYQEKLSVPLFALLSMMNTQSQIKDEN